MARPPAAEHFMRPRPLQRRVRRVLHLPTSEDRIQQLYLVGDRSLFQIVVSRAVRGKGPTLTRVEVEDALGSLFIGTRASSKDLRCAYPRVDPWTLPLPLNAPVHNNVPERNIGVFFAAKRPKIRSFNGRKYHNVRFCVCLYNDCSQISVRFTWELQINACSRYPR
jgi:hypothetical protein